MTRTAKIETEHAAGRAIRGEPEAAAPDALFAGPALSRRDGPLYRQVADRIREATEGGALRPGDSLPREADLAASFGVSLITVRQALRELEGEGLVRKRTAKPAVIVSPPSRPTNARDFNSLAEIVASTEGRSLRILDYRKRRSVRAQEVFGLEPGTLVHCLRAVLFVGSRPISYNTFYFAPSVGERLQRRHFDDVVVFRSVQRHLGIRLQGARITVSAELADAALAERLEYDEGGAILTVEMLYLDASGQPVELTINRNRSDCFSLQYDIPNGF